MDVVVLVLRYAHLVGFALLLGGAVSQLLAGRLRVSRAMLYGVWTQLVTGLVLAAPLRGGGDAEPAPAKLAVKALLGVMIFVMVFFSRRREAVARGHFLAIVGLALVTAAVATFWR